MSASTRALEPERRRFPATFPVPAPASRGAMFKFARHINKFNLVISRSYAPTA